MGWAQTTVVTDCGAINITLALGAPASDNLPSGFN